MAGSPTTLTHLVTEIGIGLTGMGLLFTMIGVLLFFDGGLLAVGNVSGEAHVNHPGSLYISNDRFHC